MLEGGAGVIEFDVSIAADGGFVLIHDQELDRETTGRGPLRSITAAEFAQLRLRNTEEPTATLADAVEALRHFRRPLKVQVDFKEGLPVTEEVAVGFLGAIAPLRANPQLSVVVGCLADWNLRALRRIDPTLVVGLDFYIYLDAPGEEILRLPQRVNAHGYLDDHPLGYRRLLPVTAYLEDRLETLITVVPGAKEIYVSKAFLAQALRDGLNPLAVIHRLRPDVLVDVWTINAGDADFPAILTAALDAGAEQITTDTAVQVAAHLTQALASAKP